jgi:hypothetical protein
MEAVELIGVVDMAGEGYRIKLGQKTATRLQPRIENAVADGHVNQAVFNSDRDRWFGAFCRLRYSGSLGPSRQNHVEQSFRDASFVPL